MPIEASDRSTTHSVKQEVVCVDLEVPTGKYAFQFPNQSREAARLLKYNATWEYALVVCKVEDRGMARDIYFAVSECAGGHERLILAVLVALRRS